MYDSQTLIRQARKRARAKCENALTVKPAHRQNSACLNSDHKGIGSRRLSEIHEIRSNDEVTGRTDGQKLRQPFDNAEHHRLHQVNPIHGIVPIF